MTNDNDQKPTPPAPCSKEICTFKELTELHNETQLVWGEISENFSTELSELHEDLSKISKELVQLSQNVGDHWDEFARKLKDHETKILQIKTKLDEQTLETKDQDRRISALREEFKEFLRTVREDIKNIRSDIEENRRERREDIAALNEKVETCFGELEAKRTKDLQVTKQERKEENQGMVKQISVIVAVPTSILLTVVIALIYLLFNHIAGKL